MTEEFYTKAVVLDKEPDGEADSRVFLYTEAFGKIIGRATSARKIVSKLSAHLEPLNLIDIKIVQKNRFQIVDALKIAALPTNRETLAALNLVKELAPEGEPDLDLWGVLAGKNPDGEQILGVLGFDKKFASCGICGSASLKHFLIGDLIYSCPACFFKSGSPKSFVLK
ncbi:MAG: recombination protein O N-terminal domain-containing protein [Candidatus Harrisonbacteria bacterium]|nr:recombination protein O N-terminal domain-containing protein [Candidatus Harrisonbacteria bacterium]